MDGGSVCSRYRIHFKEGSGRQKKKAISEIVLLKTREKTENDDKDRTELIRDRTVQGERKKTKIANGVYCGKKSQGKIGAMLRIRMMYAEWAAEGNRLFAFRRVT